MAGEKINTIILNNYLQKIKVNTFTHNIYHAIIIKATQNANGTLKIRGPPNKFEHTRYKVENLLR